MAVWSLALAACLWSSAMVLPELWQRITRPVPPTNALGFTLDPASEKPTIALTTSTAAEAGLRAGDHIVLIDGRPPHAGMIALDRQLAGKMGAQVTIVTASLTGKLTSHKITRDPRPYEASLAAVGLNPFLFRLLQLGIDYLFGTILLLGCAIVLMLRRYHDHLAPWASLMILALLLGNGFGGYWLTQQFANPTVPGYVTNAIGFSLLVVVLSVFPTGRFEPRWSLPVALLGIAGTIVSEPWPAAQSNLVLVVTQSLAVAAIGARYRLMPPGAGRQQIRWALFGFAASVVALFALTLAQLAELTVTDIGQAAWLRVAETLFSLAVDGLLVFCLTVSLLRWRLYDADATISRSIAFGALTLGLLATFAASEKLVELLGEQYLGERLGALAGALGAAAAAVCFVPLHHRVTHWAEKRFRGGLVRLRDGLPVLIGDMRETATPGALADAMLARVEEGARSAWRGDRGR